MDVSQKHGGDILRTIQQFTHIVYVVGNNVGYEPFFLVPVIDQPVKLGIFSIFFIRSSATDWYVKGVEKINSLFYENNQYSYILTELRLRAML